MTQLDWLRWHRDIFGKLWLSSWKPNLLDFVDICSAATAEAGN
jgi:hypothetical protein